MTLDTCPRCGSASPLGRLALCPVCLLDESDAEPLPELPGFVCESLLGRGGMSEVYRAQHLALGRPVALKVLGSELAQSPDFRVRFEREARLLAALEHPHIVRIFDYGVSPHEGPYISMELVTGGNLAERIPMPALRAVGLLLELGHALQHAHARGVLHGDIKPENVLVDGAGHVRLSDFGIARWLARPGGTGTRASRVLGTPPYMAPEAIAGHAPDARMDVYAVGVLLSEMISGNSRLPPSEHSLPANVLACVRRATDPNVDARHPNMDELCRDLERLQAELSGASPSPSSLPPDELGFLRGVALLLATASAAVLYAGLVSFSPRVMNANEPLPFIAFGTRPLGDGRVASAARFEALPALGAALCVALGLFAYALLRRHWRRAGLEVQKPELTVGASRTVLGVGGTLFGLFVGHELLVRGGLFTGLVPYLPVLGGALELGLLWAVWTAVLEALRSARPLRKEPRLWCGLALGLLPPFVHFVRLVAE